MEEENVCRTCLKSPPELLSIYSDDSLIHKLGTIAPKEVVEDDDNLPSTICEDCITDINEFYNFRSVIMNSYKVLKERQKVIVKVRKEQENNEMESIKVECIEEKMIIDDVKIEEGIDDASHSDLEETASTSKEIRTIPKSAQRDIIERLLNKKEVPPKEKLLQQLAMENKSNENISSCTQINIIRKLLSRSYKCHMCDEKFPSRVKLLGHKRTVHIRTKVCSLCGIVIRADNLRKHLAIHAAKPVKCDECGKTYKNFESLRGHQLSHKGNSFICEICGRSYNAKNKYKSHLKSHAETYTRKKPFCKICNKNVWKLKNHMLKHTGEKLYVCTCCNKSLSSNTALKVHMRQHTNEKPFQCNYCSVAFAHKPSLQTHLKTKHNAIL